MLAELKEAAEAGVTEAEAVDIYGDFVAANNEMFQRVTTDMETIEPPVEVREAHNEFVAIFLEKLDFSADIVVKAEGAESRGDVDEITEEINGPVATDILDRQYQACLALQAIAVDNGIDVNLDCSGEE